MTQPVNIRSTGTRPIVLVAKPNAVEVTRLVDWNTDEVVGTLTWQQIEQLLAARDSNPSR